MEPGYGTGAVREAQNARAIAWILLQSKPSAYHRADVFFHVESERCLLFDSELIAPQGVGCQRIAADAHLASVGKWNGRRCAEDDQVDGHASLCSLEHFYPEDEV